MRHRSARSADSQAAPHETEWFEEAVRGNAGLVYWTCYRILCNRAEAEDAVQDCFLKLLQRPPATHANLAAWLHRVATNRCLDLVRSKTRRRSREMDWLEGQTPGHAPGWDDFQDVVDAAIESLPEIQRAAVVAHYLEGETQEAIAEAHSVSRAAISQRIKSGIQGIRSYLAKRGIAVPAAVLAASLEANASQAAPATVLVKVLKLGLASRALTSESAGVGATAVVAKAGLPLGQKWVLALAVLALAGAGWWMSAKPDAETAISKTAASAMPSEVAKSEPDSGDGGASPPSTVANPRQRDAKAWSAKSTDSETIGSTVAEPEKGVSLDPAQLSARELWAKVLETNRPWLDPMHVELSYVSEIGGPTPPNLDRATYRQKVWISGSQGRKETRGETLVFRGGETVSLDPPDALEASPRRRPGLARSARQGLGLYVGVHALADRGLPASARIVEMRQEGGRKVAVIEAHLTDAQGGWWWPGQGYGFSVDIVRVAVDAETNVPLREEDVKFLETGSRTQAFEFGPAYFELDKRRAPRMIAWERSVEDFRTHKKHLHRTEAQFQVVDGVWVMDRTQTSVDGVPLRSFTYLTNVSTAPIDPALIHYPDEAELAALKARWLPSEFLAEDDGLGRPKVVAVYPPHGTVDVDWDVTLRVAFDQPMDPDSLRLEFEKGGAVDCRQITYDADTYTFSLPVRLTRGERQRIRVNSRDSGDLLMNYGFRSREGLGALPFRWSFQTRTTRSDPNVDKPKVLSITPPDGANVPRMTTIRIVFDQPMQPDAYALKTVQEENGVGPVGIMPRVKYIEESNTFEIPIGIDANWDGEVELYGFVSAQGAAADPVRLRLATGEKKVSEEVEKERERARSDRRLYAVLSDMQAARGRLGSQWERVYDYYLPTFKFGSTSGAMRSIHVNTSEFGFHGTQQFYGDVSSTMGSLFVIGTDGARCWKLAGHPGTGERLLQSVSTEMMDVHEVRMCDPFHLSELGVGDAIEEQQLVYAGEETVDGRLCYVIKADRGPSSEFVGQMRWYIDTSTLLPLQLVYYGPGSVSRRVFEYEQINGPIPGARFQPPDPDNTVPEEPTALSPGYDRRYLTVKDGSDGHLSLRWGMMGPKGTRNSGLN